MPIWHVWHCQDVRCAGAEAVRAAGRQVRQKRQERFWEARMRKARAQQRTADVVSLEKDIHLVRAPGGRGGRREGRGGRGAEAGAQARAAARAGGAGRAAGDAGVREIASWRAWLAAGAAMLAWAACAERVSAMFVCSTPGTSVTLGWDGGGGWAGS